MENTNNFQDNETRMTLFDIEGNTLFEAEVLKAEVSEKDLDTILDTDVSILQTQEKNNKPQHLKINTLLIGKYRILKLLGQGGLGMAYLAEEINSRNKVVIKEFFPKNFVTRGDNDQVSLKKDATAQELKTYNKMKEVFEEEARNLVIVNRTQHKNVVGFFALEKDVNNTVYFLMPYAEGEELEEYLNRLEKNGEKLNQKEILSIILPVLNGLIHIHSFNIYHKDIKPANIYIRKDDEPMLIDFGASVTSAHLLTPSYAPIEQVNKLDKKYGPYTDIYAVGVMVYKMITNTMPPKSKDRADAISKGESDPYQPLIENSEIKKKFDKHFLKAIDHALELGYENRPQTAQEFKEELSGDLKRKKIRRISIVLLIALLSSIGVYEILRDKIGFLEIVATGNSDVYIDDELKKPNSKSKEGNNIYNLKEGEHILRIEKENFVSTQPKYTFNIAEDKITRKKIDFVRDSIHLIIITLDNKGKYIKSNIFVNEDSEYGTKRDFQSFYSIKNNGINQQFRIYAKKDGYLNSKIETFTYKELVNKNKITLSLIKKEGSLFISNPHGFRIQIDGKPQKNAENIYKTIPVTINGLSAGKHKILLYSIERESFGEKNILKYKRIKKEVIIEHNQTLELRDFVKEKSDEYKKAKAKLASNISNNSYSKKVFYQPIMPKTTKVNGITIGTTEVTYNELVRFLNSVNLSSDELKKYFYTNSRNIAGYIKKEKNNNGTYDFYVTKGYADYPVVYISWYGAKAYAKWLSSQGTAKYRLPTSQEWEQVANKGFDVMRLDEYAHYAENTSSISAVKTKKPTQEGIYDLFGNVSEWCEDKLGNYSRIIHGGSYKMNKQYLRPTKKYGMNAASTKNDDIGFRLIQE